MQKTDVYVVMTNNTINSITSDPNVADQIKAKSPNSVVKRFPMISKFQDGRGIVGEALDEAMDPYVRDAQVIFNKCKAYCTDMRAIRQCVAKYLPMVNRPSTDLAVMSAHVAELAQDAGLLEALDGDFEMGAETGGDVSLDQDGVEFVDGPPPSDDGMDQSPMDGEGQAEAEFICMDLPLATRIFGYISQHEVDPTQIEELVEKISALGNETDDVLTLDHFDQLVGEDRADMDDMDDMDRTDNMGNDGDMGDMGDMDGTDNMSNDDGMDSGEIQEDRHRRPGSSRRMGSTKLADRDYDHDGRIETSSEEHYGAVGNAIRRSQRRMAREGSAYQTGYSASTGYRSAPPRSNQQSQNQSEYARGFADGKLRRPMNEGVETFSKFLATIEKKSPVPSSVSTLYKAKKQKDATDETHFEVVQDDNTSAVKITNK